MAKKPIQTISGTQDLTADELSISFTVQEHNIEIISAHIKATVNISEVITLTRLSAEGATFEFLLNTETLSAAQHYSFKPSWEVKAKKGDVITLLLANTTTTGEASGQILYREDT